MNQRPIDRVINGAVVALFIMLGMLRLHRLATRLQAVLGLEDHA